MTVPTRLVAVVVALAAVVSAVHAQEGWPRVVDEGGYVVTLYQPQIDSFEGDRVQARAAVSVKEADGAGAPVFGAVWLDARIEVDRVERRVHVREIAVPDVRFPDASEEDRDKLAKLLESRAPQWEISFDLDLLVADLDEGGVDFETPGLNHEPPRIVHSTEPAILLRYDGEPVFREMPEAKGVERAINTPFPVLRLAGKETVYLSGGGNLWYEAADPLGPWAVTGKVPKKIAALAAEASPDEEGENDEEDADEQPPAIVVATEPTELIVTEGPPRWVPVAGETLLYCDNTDADVFLEISTQSYYLLLSGRWYRGVAVDDAMTWTHVPNDELPEAFTDIPEDSVNAHVLASVAGTTAAREAALDNAIPQTAAIRRDDASLTVKYDGEPAFEPVERVEEVRYAVNTESSVFRVGDRYFACDEAVWYVSASATGPWAVATEIPAVLYDIPPSNPHHNVTYVRVYDVTPQVVYVGYTPGYVGSYWYGGCVVWGTGWYYRPWYGPYYYPRPWTWGLSVRYNPYYGWSFGLTWSNGPFRVSVGWGGGYRYPGWYGPGGYRPVYRPYPHPGYHKPVARPLPTRPPTAGRPGQPSTRPSTMPSTRPGGGSIYDRPATADRRAPQRPATADRKRPGPAQQPNDVLTDRSGNVYRKNDKGGWEQNRGGSWQPAEGLDRARPGTAERPSGGARPSQPSSRPSQPSTRPSQPSTRPSTPSTRPSYPSAGASRPQLERDARARQRGSQRSGQFHSGGGAARRPAGGGGRRR